MLRIVSAALEDALRRRWSPVHVAARLAQSTTHLCSTRSRWVLVRFSHNVYTNT